jgi:hypothetical protein
VIQQGELAETVELTRRDTLKLAAALEISHVLKGCSMATKDTQAKLGGYRRGHCRLPYLDCHAVPGESISFLASLTWRVFYEGGVR